MEPPCDRPTVLSESECRELYGLSDLGYLTAVQGGTPAFVPVRISIVGTDVLLRPVALQDLLDDRDSALVRLTVDPKTLGQANVTLVGWFWGDQVSVDGQSASERCYRMAGEYASANRLPLAPSDVAHEFD